MVTILLLLFLNINECPVEKKVYRNLTGVKRIDNFLYRQQKRFWSSPKRKEKKNEKTKHALPSNNGNYDRVFRIDEL